MQLSDLEASFGSDFSVLELPPTPQGSAESKTAVDPQERPQPERQPKQEQPEDADEDSPATHDADANMQLERKNRERPLLDEAPSLKVQASLHPSVGALPSLDTAGEEPEPEPELEPEPEVEQPEVEPQPEPVAEPEPEPEPELLLSLPKTKKKKHHPKSLEVNVENVTAAAPTAEPSLEPEPQPQAHRDKQRDDSHPRSRPEPEPASEQTPGHRQLNAAFAAQIDAAREFEATADWPGAVAAYEAALASPHPSAARSELLCGLRRAQSAATRQAAAAITQTLPECRDTTSTFANAMQPDSHVVELEFEAPPGPGRHYHRVLLAETRLHSQSDRDWQEVGHEVLQKTGESRGGWWQTLPSCKGGHGCAVPPPPAPSKIRMNYIPATTQLLRFTLVGGMTTYQTWRAGRTLGRSHPISLGQIVASRLQPMEEEAIRHIRADRHMALHRLLAVGKCSIDALWDGISLLSQAQDLGSLACVVLLEQHGGRCFDFRSSATGGPGGGKSEAPVAVSLPPLADISPVWEYLPYRVEQMVGTSQGKGWVEFSTEQSNVIERAMASGSQTLIRMFHHGHQHILDPVSLTQERPGHKQPGSNTRKPGDEPNFVVEFIRRRPWPVLLVGGALLKSDLDVEIGQNDTMEEKVGKPVLAAQMARHPDRAVSTEFAEVKAGVARFARQFKRYEQGFQGKSTAQKDSWTEVWLPNPHSVSDLPERNVVYTGGPAW